MISSRLVGDDLGAFVRGAYDDAQTANQAAPRISAFRAARDLRGQIKARFKVKHRLYAAPGWSKGILVRKRGPTRYEVTDKATYTKGRTIRVGLSWVYDNAPVIAGKKGWVAVPIEARAPIAPSGRRYMWPSEAAQAGWELEIAPVMGKRYKLIFGRRGRHDAWVALWYYIPPYRARKGLDLGGIHRRHDQRMDAVWGEELDKLTAKRVRKRV